MPPALRTACCPCDRRSLLLRGLGGALGLLAAPELLGLAARGQERVRDGSVDGVLLVWLKGGASHLDTFDPKPGTREGGPTRAIETAVRGVQLSEHLPRLAERLDRLALVRSLAAREGDHERASYLIHTGFTPSTTLAHPTLGALLGAERGREGDVPAFVSLGSEPVGPGYRGVAHAAFEVQEGARSPLQRDAALDAGRLRRRRELAGDLEAAFARAAGLATDQGTSARAAAWARAERLLAGPLGRALELDEETAGVRDLYGRHGTGQALLRARRLVEAGVGCVEVVVEGWDDHADLFTNLPPRARALDQALAGLFDDLHGRGRLARTLVLCLGEFGRTPEVNERGGRDHWPQSNSALLFGGGLRPGVIGATTPDGRAPDGRAVRVADLFATVLARLGLDPAAERLAGERPVTLADHGAPLAELLPG